MRSLPILAACAVFVAGCAPIFSDLQDAHVVESGSGEFTPFVTTTKVQDDDGYERVVDQIGFQVAEGMGNDVELRFRIEHFMDLESFDSGEVTAFGVGVKKGFIPGRLAVHLPVGLAVGSGLDVSRTFQTQPTVLVTAPVAPWVDFNPSVKALIPLGDGEQQTQAAINLGLGIHNGDRSVTVRPEVGWLFENAPDAGFMHFSLGVTFRRPVAE